MGIRNLNTMTLERWTLLLPTYWLWSRWNNHKNGTSKKWPTHNIEGHWLKENSTTQNTKTKSNLKIDWTSTSCSVRDKTRCKNPTSCKRNHIIIGGVNYDFKICKFFFFFFFILPFCLLFFFYKYQITVSIFPKKQLAYLLAK